MSVYTVVGRDELAAWLAPLAVGDLLDHAGIAAGMQNSNYFVDTTRGRYVLTLFEHIDPANLDFYLRLQSHLAQHGLPCPDPCPGPHGQRWRPLCGKPAALLSCLPGKAIEAPTPAHCRTVGEVLARLHLAAGELTDAPDNPCGAAWRAAVGHDLLPDLAADEQALLRDELAFQQAQDWTALPRGVIHADLFRDNVLWSGAETEPLASLSGLLDFYFAGVDAWLFDLAIAANDWCPSTDRLHALIAGYQSRRPLEAAERAAWPAMRRAAALRFWLLRLDALHRPRPGDVVTRKDPAECRRQLENFRLAPSPLPG